MTKRAKPKADHHKGTYHVRSRKVRDAANRNPSTRCWRCGRTILEVRRTDNPRAYWTAGHVNAGEINGELRPECSPCNFRHGQKLAMKGRNRRPQPVERWRNPAY